MQMTKSKTRSTSSSPMSEAPRIQVHNLYYLLCYGWDRLREGEIVDVSSLDANRPQDLFARVLTEGVSRALRRGLDRNYLSKSNDTAGPRGKFDISSSIKRCLLTRGQVVCSFDELSHDIMHNQILKAAIRKLAAADDLASQLRHRLNQLSRRLTEISDTEIAPQSFRRVRFHRNNVHYSVLLHIAEFILTYLLPEPGNGRLNFNSFLGNATEMGHLFEAFVRNYLAREQQVYRVGRENLRWTTTLRGEEPHPWLPVMRTDASLRRPGRTIIIETKFTQQTYQQQRNGKPKVRSDHLYQLFAYLKSLESRTGPDRHALGVLLYAQADRALNLRFRLPEHELWVRTIDLSRSWQEIGSQLFKVVEDADGSMHLPSEETPGRPVH